MDLLTVKFLISYITRPLHFFGAGGLLLFSAGFGVASIITLMYYFSDLAINDHLGNLIFSLLCMVLGIQLIALGLSLEVSVRTYHATHERTIYAIKEAFLRGDGPAV